MRGRVSSGQSVDRGLEPARPPGLRSGRQMCTTSFRFPTAQGDRRPSCCRSPSTSACSSAPSPGAILGAPPGRCYRCSVATWWTTSSAMRPRSTGTSRQCSGWCRRSSSGPSSPCTQRRPTSSGPGALCSEPSPPAAAASPTGSGPEHGGDAGFFQVIEGQTTDRAKFKELERNIEDSTISGPTSRAASGVVVGRQVARA